MPARALRLLAIGSFAFMFIPYGLLPTTIDRVRRTATARVNRLDPVYTLAVPGPFTRAEEYHQAYLQKNPGGYTCHWMRD